MVLEKLKELSEMLETNQNSDWDANDPSKEFEALKVIVDDIRDKFSVLTEYNESGYFGMNWSLPDIIGKAEELGFKCSEEDAREIADHIESKADCEYGITWDTLGYYIESHFPKN